MDIEHSELRLPPALLAKANLRGDEYGWRRADLPDVFAAAQSAGLANLGGQVQFRLADGTCELYWQNFDPGERSAGEPWADFVKRTRAEVARAVARLPDDLELVADGVRSFAFLAEKTAQGADIEATLLFVCYFASEAHWDFLSKISKRLPNGR